MTDSFQLEDYQFDLPTERIAQAPAEPRHAARLLHLDRARAGLIHGTVMDLCTRLPPRCLLVVNDTQVVPARLHAVKESGGRVELLLCEPAGHGGGDPAHQPALVRSSKPVRVGARLKIVGSEVTAAVRSVEAGGLAVLAFEGVEDLGPLLATAGHVPLPPYIRGGRESASGEDRLRYQCVYAARPGAVAAPTAGLHFSHALLEGLDAAGVERCAVTLHVGPGTFLPVRTDDLRAHRVLPERFLLGAEAAEQIAAARRDRRPIIAVGTTTTRVLETLAARHPGGAWPAGPGLADLTILPGHRFAAISGLVSNFHLPASSLLVLVAAFAGRERVLAAYREAVALGYRFYSYGDATLLT